MQGAVVNGCLIGKGATISTNAILTDVIVNHGAIVPSGHIQTGGTF